MESISPPPASLIWSSFGRSPTYFSVMRFSSASLQSFWSSESPENPISRPWLACASSSAKTASGIIIVASRYSPFSIKAVTRPSMTTLVSGTSIMRYSSILWGFHLILYYCLDCVSVCFLLCFECPNEQSL